MRDHEVGRVLVASLHEAIADKAPARLGFYESFLPPDGLRDGSVSLAQVLAVLSFLRQEGPEYARITDRAAEYAVDWTIAGMRPVTRSLLALAPPWLRFRLVLNQCTKLVAATYPRGRAWWHVRGAHASLTLADSIFCGVRTPAPMALCGFYAHAFEALHAAFGLPASCVVRECRSAGAGATCALALSRRSGAGHVTAEATREVA